MPTTLDLAGLDRLTAGLRALGDPDATPLMLTWMRVIEEDNRRGILQGLDKDGVPMAPVTYRPRVYSPHSRLKPTKEQRGGARANAKRGAFQGLGATAYGNLASSEYRLLGGPPLAPRDQFSRVVTNLFAAFDREGSIERADRWVAYGYWDEVLDKDGQPFLHYHFEGSGHNPRRDLRGVRPDGIRRALEALKAWARDLLRQAFGR